MIVRAGGDCHERRRELHVDHEAAAQPPLRIELAGERER